MNRIYKLALPVVLTLFLCACGQRGPLYLPEQAPNNKSKPEKVSEVPHKTNTDEGL
jgi:predicted small lipoprotein YifL